MILLKMQYMCNLLFHVRRFMVSCQRPRTQGQAMSSSDTSLFPHQLIRRWDRMILSPQQLCRNRWCRRAGDAMIWLAADWGWQAPPASPFSTWNHRYLIPRQAHFRRVLKRHPFSRKNGADRAGAKWFTLDEVLTLRR
jgi:hypothetical protein